MTASIKILFALTFLVLSTFSCKSSAVETKTPKVEAKTSKNDKSQSCIEDKINTFKSETRTNPPTEIWEWKIDGKIYYLITSECCDNFNYLYNKDCKKVCAPEGGFTGRGNGMCPDYSKKAEKKLFWKDSRQK